MWFRSFLAVLFACSVALYASASIDEQNPFWQLLLTGKMEQPSSSEVPQTTENQAAPVPEPAPAPTSDAAEPIPAENRAPETDGDRRAAETPPEPPLPVEVKPESASVTPAEQGSEKPPADRHAGLTPIVLHPGYGKFAPRVVASSPSVFSSMPYDRMRLSNMKPLYTQPEIPGEGVWTSAGLPTGLSGEPVMYRTSYRPSIEYPNAVVHMLILDMKKLDVRLYIGSTEPGGSTSTASIEPDIRQNLLAVTNALWKQKHAGEAGAIMRGKVIKPLCPGMATMVVYNDGSPDILEWNAGIPLSCVSDARQLRHLIVKNGKVVDTVIKSGRNSDSEIGLGLLLVEDTQAAAPEQYWWGYGPQSSFTAGEQWFIATRSAFGIRKDGALVFAAGHHISTRDLAKALVLAECDRAIHADANPHNVLANLYVRNSDGAVVKRAKLSPDQRDTLNRYDRHYTSDFFGFFIKPEERKPL